MWRSRFVAPSVVSEPTITGRRTERITMTTPTCAIPKAFSLAATWPIASMNRPVMQPTGMESPSDLRLAKGFNLGIALTVALAFATSPALAVSKPSFSDYPIKQIYNGRGAMPILSTKEARAYRTALREGSRQTTNFAGHYRFVTGGCGTSCQEGAVVDRISGHVTFVPFSVCCTEKPYTKGFEEIKFRSDSQLVVFTGLINQKKPDAEHYYMFDGNTFNFVSSVPITSH